MKRRLSIMLFIVLAMTAKSFSQQSKPIVPDNVKILHTGNGYLNNIHMRAVRDFVCRYEKATDVAWFAVPDGFIVRFTADSTNARSAYKKNGI